jgi:hypothetical protein
VSFPRAAVERVVAGATFEVVVAVATVQLVIAGRAEDRVGPPPPLIVSLPSLP